MNTLIMIMAMVMARSLAAATAIMLITGCETFATLAELAEPRILAIRANPMAVAPGQSAQISILVNAAGQGVQTARCSSRSRRC